VARSLYALHLIERIGALLRSEVRRTSADDGLEPVHILALWYLSRANKFSDNPLAVGNFLGLSKGNMSQRLILLQDKGFLRKTSDTQDKRRVHLGVTPSGRAALARNYPPASWPKEIHTQLERELDLLLRTLVAANGSRTFGLCKTCRFHQPGKTGALCGLLNIPLAPHQSDQICQEHEASESR
jgi:DNA-binding MarR family transcriptional regulator